MTDADWYDQGLRTLGLFLAGDAIRTRGERGETTKDDSFLLWLHSGAAPVTVTLPDLCTTYTEVVRTDRLRPAGERAGARRTQRAAAAGPVTRDPRSGRRQCLADPARSGCQSAAPSLLSVGRPSRPSSAGVASSRLRARTRTV